MLLQKSNYSAPTSAFPILFFAINLLLCPFCLRHK